MTSKDFIDANLKMAAVAASLLNFFIVATLAIMGWFFSSETLINTPPFSLERVTISALYGLLGLFSFLTHARFMSRIYVGWTLAKKVAGPELAQDENFKIYVAHYPYYGTYVGIPLGTITVVLALLFINGTGSLI